MWRRRLDTAAETLQSGLHRSTGRGWRRIRGVLVTTETALAVIVIVGAGLLLQTVRNLTAVTPDSSARAW